MLLYLKFAPGLAIFLAGTFGSLYGRVAYDTRNRSASPNPPSHSTEMWRIIYNTDYFKNKKIYFV